MDKKVEEEDILNEAERDGYGEGDMEKERDRER